MVKPWAEDVHWRQLEFHVGNGAQIGRGKHGRDRCIIRVRKREESGVIRLLTQPVGKRFSEPEFFWEHASGFETLPLSHSNCSNIPKVVQVVHNGSTDKQTALATGEPQQSSQPKRLKLGQLTLRPQKDSFSSTWISTITHVCRYRREVALATPSLWSYIRITEGTCGSEHLKAFIARSKALLFDLLDIFQSSESWASVTVWHAPTRTLIVVGSLAHFPRTWGHM
ncbi:hypothetical protein BXZ70DRAFT_1080947 [Cristinia sonorae]|uniref:Uncharacterized protein n=1 Tax=Cristinia sonorae TaxID=1940300 RepID=A0A8K0UFY9_9AGAR|nr:hypothetical protein BXZ70DRAFT_1080947 [Cristinia sonorae]